MTTSSVMLEPFKLSRLERAASILEIREVLARLVRGIDRGDHDLAASCYHDDAMEDHGPFKGKALEFISIVMPRMAHHEIVAFHISTVSVEFAGEDRALSEAYYLGIMHEGASPNDTFISGRYLDRFERRNGQWRIAARVALVDWWSIVPRNDVRLPEDVAPKLTYGKHGLDDPYYSVRAAFQRYSDDYRASE